MRDNITVLHYEDKEITLIGTAHVLKESVDLVKETIDTVRPDTVCIELDAERYKNMLNPKAWENTSVIQIIKEKKVGMLLANLILGSYQKQVAKKRESKPGQEMLQGILSAKEYGCELVLADRNIQTTLLRIWRKLSFLEKWKLFVSLLSDNDHTEDAIHLDDLMEKENMEAILSYFGKDFPQIATVLIHERDQHLAYKIKTAPGKKIVAVVGAAHVPGIQKELYCKQDLQSITLVPKASRVGKVVGWIIPIALLLLMGYGFLTNRETGLQQLQSWVLWSSGLAALFTALALGHPLTILTAFVAAPITSLNPLLACGWFAGLTEASIRKPTVRDVNRVFEDIFSIKGFFTNRFLRALLIVFLANMGTSIGTLIAGTNIIRHIF